MQIELTTEQRQQLRREFFAELGRKGGASVQGEVASNRARKAYATRRANLAKKAAAQGGTKNE